MAEEKKINSAPAKAVTAVKKDEDAKTGIFQKIGKWFREMRSELKKVVWPSRKQLTNNTLVSLAVMLVSAVGIWVFDELAQLLIKGIYALCGIG